MVLSEPEDIVWKELVIELLIDVDTDEEALRLWTDIGEKIDEAKAALGSEDRDWFNDRFAVHLIWGDEGDGDATSSV